MTPFYVDVINVCHLYIRQINMSTFAGDIDKEIIANKLLCECSMYYFWN